MNCEKTKRKAEYNTLTATIKTDSFRCYSEKTIGPIASRNIVNPCSLYCQQKSNEFRKKADFDWKGLTAKRKNAFV
ncbi:MAG: hypothetical protein NTV30_08700 [Chloroflexi bacterium]|nr:hypothetical protein [Chloroflexota bacterium]